MQLEAQYDPMQVEPFAEQQSGLNLVVVVVVLVQQSFFELGL